MIKRYSYGKALSIAILALLVHSASAQEVQDSNTAGASTQVAQVAATQSASPTLAQLNANYQQAANAEDWKQAATIANQAYLAGKQLYSTEDPLLADLAGQLGHAQLQLGDTASIDALTQALGIKTRVFGEESEKILPNLMDFGASQVLVGNLDAAKDTFNRALDIAEDTFGKGSTMLAKLSSEAGNAYFNAGEYRLASSYIYDTYDIYKTMFGAFSTKTGDAAYRVAKLKEALGNYSGMALSLKQAVATFPDPTTPANDYERSVHQDLVIAYHASDKPEKATPHVLALARTSKTDTSEPTLVVKPSPSYRGSKLDGFVTIRYDVDQQGFVKNTQLIENEGNRKLVSAAMKALDGYRYIPVFKDGQTISTTGLETKIIFKWDDV